MAGDNAKYAYDPSLPAAAIFIACFALTTLVHTFQLFRTKTWFMIPFVVGGICEIIGYIARVVSATEAPGPYSRAPYIVQFVALLVAPSFLAASVYMILGRIVLALRADQALPWIQRKVLTKLFVVGDVVAFLLQAAGGGIMAGGGGKRETGEGIVIGGLFVQLAFLGGFVCVAGVFHWRMARRGAMVEARGWGWRKHMYVLYLVSILIFVRSIVRVIEFIQGFDGHIFSHEVYLYIFDALIMCIAMVVMNVVHPCEIWRIVAEQEGKGQNVRENEMETWQGEERGV